MFHYFILITRLPQIAKMKRISEHVLFVRPFVLLIVMLRVSVSSGLCFSLCLSDWGTVTNFMSSKSEMPRPPKRTWELFYSNFHSCYSLPKWKLFACLWLSHAAIVSYSWVTVPKTPGLRCMLWKHGTVVGTSWPPLGWIGGNLQTTSFPFYSAEIWVGSIYNYRPVGFVRSKHGLAWSRDYLLNYCIVVHAQTHFLFCTVAAEESRQ